MVDIPTRAAIRDTLYQYLSNDNCFKAWKVVETSTVEYGAKEGIIPSIYRLTCDMDVSLESFRSFCSSTANMKMADSHVASIDIPYIDDLSRVECTHIKGKATSLTAARDFCTYQTMDTLDYESLSDKEKRLLKDLARTADGPLTKGVSRGARVEYPSQVFVLSAVNSKTVPEIPDFVRGTVHSLGYIAFPLTDNLIRVVYVSCVDPKGNIPKFALDAANAETASRIELIKTYCKVLDNVSRSLEFPFPKASCDMSGKESPPAPEETKRTSKKTEKTQSIKSERNSTSNATAAPTTTVVPALPLAERAQAATVKAAAPAVETTTAPKNEEIEPAAQEQVAVAAPQEEEVVDAAPIKPLTPEERLPERLRMSKAKRAHMSKMLSLHTNSNWRTVKTLENCLLEEQEVDFTIFKAVRISTDFNCSIATFMQVLGEQKHMKVYDPKLEKFETLGEDKSISGVKVYSAYKRESRFISPRDFYTLSAAALLNSPEAINKEGLNQVGSELVYVQGTQSIDGKPDVTGWVRGVLHVFGYICYADEANSNRITVHNLMCADPNGSIPKFAMDAANADSCKKLAIIRRLCEEQHQTAPAALPVAEPVAATTAPQKKKANVSTAAPIVNRNKSPEPIRPYNPAPNTNGGVPLSGALSSPDINSSMESSVSFQSCLDEDEVQKDMQSMRQFYFHEVDSIVNRLISLHNFDGWSTKETINGSRLETVLTPLCDKKAVRASCEMQCTIDDFWNVISNINLLRRYDPDLEKLDVLKSPSYGTVMHTSYRGNKTIQSRDFCTITASKFLSEEEGSDAGLYTPGFNASSLVVNSLDCDDCPPEKNYTRGRVFAHGFIAVATPPTAKRIRVFHLALIDPQGVIPSKVVDLAASGLAKKLNVIKEMCESHHVGELSAVPDTASFLVKKAHGGDSNALIEPMSILGPMLRQHSNAHWSGTTIINKCTVQTAELEDNPNMLVVRASMEIPCTLSTFESVINNSDSRRRLDENIESLRFLPGPPNASVSIVGFRRDDSKAPHANCAFCEISMGKQLSAEEVAGFDLSSMKAAVYVHSAIGWEHGLSKEQLTSFGSYEVGRLNINGYMGIAIPPTAPRIRVSHQWCVTTYDPKKEVTADKKHKKNVEYIKHDMASRLIMLAAMCQDRQGLREEALHQFGGGTGRAESPTNSEDYSELGAKAVATERTHGSPRSDISPPDSPPPHVSKALPPSSAVPLSAEPTPVQTPSPTPRVEDSDNAVVSPVAVDLSKRDIFSRLLELHKRRDWNQVKVVDECVLEYTTVDYCKLNANKVSTDFACELETFKEFMGEEANLKEYDPKLETLKLVKTIEGDISLLYSAYKRESRLIAPREFLTRNIAILLSHEDAASNGLLSHNNTQGAAFLQLSRSYVEDADLHDVERGWVRGFIHTHGYVAIREGPKGSKKIKIHSISCVDPNGSIPKFAMDAAAAQTCKTIALIRSLCEEEESRKN